MCLSKKQGDFIKLVFLKCIFLSALAFSFSQLYAVDFTFEMALGLKGGVTKEYVYKEDKCISRLDWNDEIIPMLAFAVKAEFFNVIIQTRIDSAIPVKSGVMEDYVGNFSAGIIFRP
jgi:outer membrane protease